jgi:hypothetical protein
MQELGVGKSNAKNILNMIDVIKRTSNTWGQHETESVENLAKRLGLPMDAIDYIAFGIWRILYGLLSNSGCGVWEPNLDAFTNRDKG